MRVCVGVQRLSILYKKHGVLILLQISDSAENDKAV